VRIRIRNKYLILSVIIFITAAGLVYASGSYYLYRKAEMARVNEDYVSALAYYDALITKYPNDERVFEALKHTVDILTSGGRDIVASFTHNSSSRTVLPPGYEHIQLGSDVLTLEERLWMLYDHYMDPENVHIKGYELRRVFDMLGEIIEGRGFGKAEEFYWNIINNRKWSIMFEATRRLVHLYLHYGMFDEATAVVEHAKAYASSEPDPLRLMGDIYFAQGDFERAEAVYTQVPWDWHVYQRMELIRNNKGKEAHLVEGVVTYDGAPFPGVKVFVYPGPEVRVTDSGSRRISQSNQEIYEVMSRHDGRFSLVLPDGTYDIGIALNMAQMVQVDGYQLQIKNSTPTLSTGMSKPEQVEFNFVKPVTLIQPGPDFEYGGGPIFLEWTPYPGADYYEVIVHYSFFNPILNWSSVGIPTVTSEQTSVWLDGLLDPPFLMSYDGEGIKPRALLGMPDQISVAIRAYTEDGQSVSSSDVLNLFGKPNPWELGVISLKQRPLRPEEELILERKYDEAFELLQQRLTETPDDLDALWLLVRFYYCGTRPIDRTGFRIAGRDLVKCLETLRRIEAIKPSAQVSKAIEMVEQELELTTENTK